MPIHIKKSQLLSKKYLDKNVLSNHINVGITNRLIGKVSSESMLVYSSQNPYGGPNDAGTWVRNPNCWINSVTNISCFSPAQRSGANWWQRGGVLLTKKHILFAKHFAPAILSGGTPIIFVDENNNAIRRNLIQYGLDNTDIAIGLFDSEVPSNIKIAKVLPPNFTDYINCSIVTSNGDFQTIGDILLNPLLYAVALDQEEKAIFKVCYNFGQKYFVSGNGSGFGGNNSPWIYANLFNPSQTSDDTQFRYPDFTKFQSFSENIVTGDSGNPIFFIIDNELVVLATWHTPVAGPFITSRYSEVNSIIESLSPNEGYSLTPIDLQQVYNKLTSQSVQKITIKSNNINKNVLSNHINVSTSNRLFGKTPSVNMSVYSSQNPYGGVGDAGIWVRNPNCWINGVSNISCFSPAQRSGANWWQRGGTLLTKKHMLFAAHFAPAILSGSGTPIIFVDENNNAIRRNLIQYALDTFPEGTTDIAIGLLDEEVPNNIKIAKVLPPNFTDYINTTPAGYGFTNNPPLYCVALDQEEKAILKLWADVATYIVGNTGSFWLMTRTTESISDQNYPTLYPKASLFATWFESMIVGDSGNPLFLIIDNELVILSAYWVPTGGAFVTNRYNIVNSLIENLSPGQGYSLTPVDLATVYSKYS